MLRPSAYSLALSATSPDPFAKVLPVHSFQRRPWPLQTAAPYWAGAGGGE